MTTEQNKSPPLPLPFRVSAFEINADGDNRVIMGADNFSIAHLMDRLPEENADIAEFIVHACNSHSELLAGLNDLQRAAEAHLAAEDGSERPWLVEELANSRTLLVKARGQQ